MTNIYPLIICGGNGTRLWPVSRTQSPKQFQKVGDEASLTFFQSAVERHRGPGYQMPCIVSAARHRETIAKQLAEISAEAHVIHEPMGRNTGPAVLAAAMMLYDKDPSALMVVVPADHVIEGDINSTIMAMATSAAAGYIVTFGIKPRYAETGFGYITDGGPVIDFPGLHKVDRFVEKPPTRKARLLVESDIAYWASGISMFSAKTIIEEYRKFDAPTVAAVNRAIAQGRQCPDGFELESTSFVEAASNPTEVAVFEKTDKIALAPLDVDWSDVGSWTAMYGISKANAQGNVLQGDVIAVETTNSMVRSTSRLVTVVGMKDVIVIETPDALLVTRVGHCQNVKKVAEYLKHGNRPEAEKHVPAAARAAVDQRDAAGMTRIFQSETMEIATARIAPGASLDVATAAGREIQVSKGELIISTIQSDAVLQAGEKMALSSFLPTTLVNGSAAEVELVMTTTVQQTASTDAETDKIRPMALYA